MDKYSWNEALILDKIQEVLNSDNLDDLEVSIKDLEIIKDELNKSTTFDEINNCAYILAKNIDELRVSENEDIKHYIVKLKSYLENTHVKTIKAEYNGIEFEVFKDCDVDEVFKEYYSKYDEIYGISQMLSDLGLK